MEQTPQMNDGSNAPLARNAEPHLVLVGPMGAGKSTAGRALAAALDRPFSDSDEEISRLLGCSGASYAAHDGVKALHRLEASLVVGALARPEPHVIAAAASVVESALVQRLLAVHAFVVRLTAPPDLLVERAGQGAHRRQMAPEEVAELMTRREWQFDKARDVEVDAQRAVDDVVAEVIRLLPIGDQAGARPR